MRNNQSTNINDESSSYNNSKGCFVIIFYSLPTAAVPEVSSYKSSLNFAQMKFIVTAALQHG
jgi:hypothetical protein